MRACLHEAISAFYQDSFGQQEEACADQVKSACMQAVLTTGVQQEVEDMKAGDLQGRLAMPRKLLPWAAESEKRQKRSQAQAFAATDPHIAIKANYVEKPVSAAARLFLQVPHLPVCALP